MYGKLFSSLYHGTLRGRAHQILVFSNLIAHSDKNGFVDKHWRAIAEECGLTVDEVKAACIELESPDPESRSPEADGARLIRIDEHRSWGWQITNYAKYRAIRCEEDRRMQNRDAKRRERQKSSLSATVSHSQPQSAHADAEVEAEVDVNTLKTVEPVKPAPAVKLTACDDIWLEALSADSTYQGIDVLREFGKMKNWCETNKKKPSRARFINWINRIERPMDIKANRELSIADFQ
jgi:hypothetical protein